MNQNNFKPMIIEPTNLGMNSYLNNLMHAPFIPFPLDLKTNNSDFENIGKIQTKFNVVDNGLLSDNYNKLLMEMENNSKIPLKYFEPVDSIIINHPRNMGMTKVINNYMQSLVTGYLDDFITKNYIKFSIKNKKLITEKYGFNFIVKYKFKHIVNKIVDNFLKEYELALKIGMINAGYYNKFPSNSFLFEYEKEFKKQLPKNKSKYF